MIAQGDGEVVVTALRHVAWVDFEEYNDSLPQFFTAI